MAFNHEQKMADLTRQMRHNQSDLQSFISDLDSWETDIKKKEENLLKKTDEEVSCIPPVRNTIHKKKLKKKKKEKVDPEKHNKKISGFDFHAWDKFDVDKAVEEIDKDNNKTSSSEYETDEEWEIERKKHLAGIEKDKGNKFFKDGEYDSAVEAYTKGIGFDSTNAVLPANRAMALLKQQKYGAAELDCTLSIALDPLYVKAYLRRATARANLSKHKEAMEDYNRVLDLEPTNKMAQTELERIQKEQERSDKAAVPSNLIQGDIGIVKPIYKSPEERSKVPLRKIDIEEIGIQTTKRNQHSLTEQSELTKKIAAQEAKNFDRLLFSNPESIKKSNQPSSNSSSPPVTNHSNQGEVNSTTFTRVSNNLPSSNTKQDRQIDMEYGDRDKVNGNVVETVPEKSPLPASSTVDSSNGSGEKRVNVPCVPQSSFQFQTDFKVLKDKPEEFFRYFTAIDPSQYPTLFGQCLDAYILTTIIKVLLQHSNGSDVNIYTILTGMTSVKRFSMTAMFLSTKEKKNVQELMSRISASNLCSEQQLSSLKKSYDL